MDTDTFKIYTERLLENVQDKISRLLQIREIHEKTKEQIWWKPCTKIDLRASILNETLDCYSEHYMLSQLLCHISFNLIFRNL